MVYGRLLYRGVVCVNKPERMTKNREARQDKEEGLGWIGMDWDGAVGVPMIRINTNDHTYSRSKCDCKSRRRRNKKHDDLLVLDRLRNRGPSQDRTRHHPRDTHQADDTTISPEEPPQKKKTDRKGEGEGGSPHLGYCGEHGETEGWFK